MAIVKKACLVPTVQHLKEFLAGLPDDLPIEEAEYSGKAAIIWWEKAEFEIGPDEYLTLEDADLFSADEFK